MYLYISFEIWYYKTGCLAWPNQVFPFLRERSINLGFFIFHDSTRPFWNFLISGGWPAGEGCTSEMRDINYSWRWRNPPSVLPPAAPKEWINVSGLRRLLIRWTYRSSNPFVSSPSYSSSLLLLYSIS